MDKIMEKLTPKEIQVIRLMSQDYTSQEIAKELGTNREYISQIKNGIYRKVGCKKSGGLMVWAFNNGILEINCKNLPNEERKAG